MHDMEKTPLALPALAVFYLFSLLLAASNLDAPFPFMGRIYRGGASEWLGFADAMMSLYLCIGILKRQRLTFWLVIGYNLLDICNALVNLAVIAPREYARLAEAPIPQEELRINTFGAILFLLLITLCLFRNRREFSNSSPYLF
jgi:hypothetical protein